MTGWAQAAAWTDRLRDTDNLLLAIWAPTESYPVTTPTHRWEEPVQTTP
jgi:hypothetical protein